MRLTFFGAANEVTGSCHCIDVNGKRILVDCGLAQGADEIDNSVFPFDATQVDYLILTHAHIDHSGRIPLLAKYGFKGKIFTTSATCHLLNIMLRDSAHIQEMETKWKNQKGQRAGKVELEPLYTVQDAENSLKLLVPCVYESDVEIEEGINIRFVDAGHLLGSASVEVVLKENNVEKKIVFSGDIGNSRQPLLRDPTYIKSADYVVMESTYGDREHEPSDDYVNDLAKIINETLSRGGNVVIPAFAVGRTQQLLYFIREIKERNLVSHNPNFPVYVDSPLATEATRIYDTDLTGYADEETIKILNSGFDPISFPNLKLIETAEDSKLINFDNTPKVIISSSGMCEAGRIRHHLKHNLWRSDCSIIFVGYQANGTLGRILIEGAKKVKLFGEEIAVEAQIHNFRGLSAHADKSGLLKWISAFEQKPQKVFVVHGEKEVSEIFGQTLNSMGLNTFIPNFEASYDIIEDKVISYGIEKQNLPHKTKKDSSVFGRLVSASQRLIEIINKNKESSNKDLAKFADQINEISNKWDR